MQLFYIEHKYRDQLYKLLHITFLIEDHVYGPDHNKVCVITFYRVVYLSRHFIVLNSKAPSIYSASSSHDFLKASTKIQGHGFFGSICKELGSHHSILTEWKT